MRASERSTSSRLEVRPAARSRASWATVHMGREYYALENRERTLRRQLLSLPGSGTRAPLRRLRRRPAAPLAPALPALRAGIAARRALRALLEPGAGVRRHARGARVRVPCRRARAGAQVPWRARACAALRGAARRAGARRA